MFQVELLTIIIIFVQFAASIRDANCLALQKFMIFKHFKRVKFLITIPSYILPP